MRFFALALVALFYAVGSATAGDGIKKAALTVKDAWSRATLARNGAAYMTIFNHGSIADRLIAAESPVAKNVELHSHKSSDGVMRMRRIPAVEVHPGKSAVLEPGGSHLMLMGLARSLKEGEVFPITLAFEKAGKVMVDIAVQKVGAVGYSDHMKRGHSHHKHSN
ncbi:MAG: hypothetical protein CFH10_00378 [Alphaproteobacteria bacterium MarineAlpha4_Bin2]|nr:MAG: hypothetical protein CFH10_00378 [Alphaproteobacteria bacterium MarineAlpha4_Bin2]